MTEQEVVDTITLVVDRISPRYTFHGYQLDDIKQEAFILCMDALPRYDESRRLENFLSVHLSNRLKNFVRDNHFMTKEDPKAKVIMPGQLSNEDYILDSKEEYVESLDYQDMRHIIDTKLPANYRADYIKIVNDVYVPKKRREEVLFVIEIILEENGYEKG